MQLAEARFELRKVADRDWLILDHRYGSDDPRRTVGCVYEVEASEVEVMWMRDIPVALRYTTAFEALEDVRRFYARSGRTAGVARGGDQPASALAAS